MSMELTFRNTDALSVTIHDGENELYGKVLEMGMPEVHVGSPVVWNMKFIFDGSSRAKEKFAVDKIIQSGNRTIILWSDHTKSVVRCPDDTHNDPYAAFTSALAQKVYGNNSQVKRLIDRKLEVQERGWNGKMRVVESYEDRKNRRKYYKKLKKEQEKKHEKVTD